MLKRQRDRWHRGLIDILSFHRSLLGNPRYGSMGLVSMLYFFIFETIGPIVEFQGYLMVIAAAFLGLLDLHIAGLLFFATILMGIVISLSSLVIAEKDQNYFTIKELMTLTGYAVFENFSFRQVMSFIRVTGYINSLKKPKGWGKMVRKGFKKS